MDPKPIPPHQPAASKPRTRGFRAIPKSTKAGTDIPVRTVRSPVSADKSIRPANRENTAPAKPTPLPKRPKGRFFIGGILLAVLVLGAYCVWDSAFRYQAYGTITGRVIHVPSQQGGNVRFLHVREGDEVAAGQLLVTLENVGLQQKLAQARDELLVTQADLDAEISKLQWQAQQRHDDKARAASEYYQLLAQVAEEERKVQELELKYERTQALVACGAGTQQELEESHYALIGKRAKLEQLTISVAERHKGIQQTWTDLSKNQLKPLWARIETLKTEMDRLRELIAQGQVRSPTCGRVLRNYFFTGEEVAPAQPVCEILECDSIEAVVFLPQSQVNRITKGSHVPLHVVAQSDPLPCTISRFGDQYVVVPANLQRYYRDKSLVLPVYFRPDRRSSRQLQLRLGSEVKLASTFSDWFGAAPTNRIRGDEQPGLPHEPDINPVAATDVKHRSPARLQFSSEDGNDEAAPDRFRLEFRTATRN